MTDANWFFVTVEGALILYVIGRLLNPVARKRSLAALMQPTRQNWVIFGLFILTGGIAIVDALITPPHGWVPSFALVCSVLVGVFGAVLLVMNLTRAHPSA